MNLTELIIDLVIQYNGIVRKAASELHLTVSQSFLILAIPPNGISMSELATKLGIDNSTLTRNIQKLELYKFINRKASSYDRRISKVFLTSKGIDTSEKLDLLLNDTSLKLSNSFDLDIQNSLIDILEKLNWQLNCIRDE